MRCSECGDAKRLTPEGVCEWRAGCEHRVRVREGREHRVMLEAEFVLLGAEARESYESFLRALGFQLDPEDDDQ